METKTVTCTKDKNRKSVPVDNYDTQADLTRTMLQPRDDCDSSDSLETASDEIPVWIHGEQRWVSGVNSDTTCADLVSVLLLDDGINVGNSSSSLQPLNKGFVITERWRRVEQILHDDTKILQIWQAWGHAKSEVKLTLRQVEPMANNWTNSSNEQDSGMGSPIGSADSAIIRRRRHRASKSTTAWVTQAHTIHPKSQKATIERLVKLILEQGETIQQQLAKLRDREYQIAKIEEERHKIREKEHGKNYLLETYLNGLHEAEEKEIAAGNSDSGVHTEGATSSPEISSCVQEDDDFQNCATTNSQPPYEPYKEKPSHREKKLLKEHKNTKEFSTLLTESKNDEDNGESSGTGSSPKPEDIEDDLSAKIEWMEKLVVINKHLQREEELLVRLGAKIRKYESEIPMLNENQVRDALARVNANIESTNNEIQKIEEDLVLSDEKLVEKSNLLETLNQELGVDDAANLVDPPAIEPQLQLSNELIAENLYTFSKYIYKPDYDSNKNNEYREGKVLSRHTPDHLLNIQQGSSPIMQHQLQHPQSLNQSTNILEKNIYFHQQQQHQQHQQQQNQMLLQHQQQHQPPVLPLPQIPLQQLQQQNLQVHHHQIEYCGAGRQTQFLDTTLPNVSVNFPVAQAPILNCRSQNPLYSASIMESMNLLHKTDQIKFNSNVYNVASSSGKLGPKKSISGICNEFESNSDTGLSSLGEDAVHLGTLV